MEKCKGQEAWPSEACDQLTRDVHATWRPTPTLRMAGLPLDWSWARRNTHANPNDILMTIDSQLTRK